jgi:hypothetical protein
MLSEKKILLRFTEVIAIAGILGALFLAVKSYWWFNPDFPFFFIELGGWVICFLTFGPACMLSAEYLQVVRKPQSWLVKLAKDDGLTASDIQFIIRWAPKIYSVGACLGIFIAIFAALKFGDINFSDDQPAKLENITGSALYFSTFYLLALPILGSAARMPGSYAYAA